MCLHLSDSRVHASFARVLGKQGYGKLAPAFPEGVLFCTYTCLISGRKSGKKSKTSRFEQLAEWFCQGNSKFDGVVRDLM